MSCRYEQLEQWQKKWLSPELKGGRKAGETRDVSLQLSLDVERAILTGSLVHGVAFDEDKFFDSQNREVSGRSSTLLGPRVKPCLAF